MWKVFPCYNVVNSSHCTVGQLDGRCSHSVSSSCYLGSAGCSLVASLLWWEDILFPIYSWAEKRKKYHMIYMLPLCNSFGQGVIISGNHSSPENHGKSPSHKSHNASNKHHTMHHFVTEMCIHGHISVTKWCIVGYGTGDL